MNCPNCAEILNNCLSSDEPPVVGWWCSDCEEFFYPEEFDADDETDADEWEGEIVDDESYTPTSIYDVLEFGKEDFSE